MNMHVMVKAPKGHPKASKHGGIKEHILIAEKALGKFLPEGVEVHHLNGKGKENKNSNLVICQDRKYHGLLHIRLRVIQRDGDPDREKICPTCQKLRSKNYFNSNQSRADGLATECISCDNQRGRRRYLKSKEPK